MIRRLSLICIITLLSNIFVPQLSFADSFQFGFAKVDITPTEPVRLSGYGNRNVPYTGIDEKLYCRVMALKNDAGKLHVLASFDTIGFGQPFTETIAAIIKKEYGITRNRFVLCGTHSHTSPQLVSFAPNLYAKPLTQEESKKTAAYTIFVNQQIVKTIKLAIANMAPGKLFFASGKATFARNRRALKNGKWSGFGVNPKGPVDHALPFLKVVGTDGKVRGILFNYACHCTTFGGNYNRINGDWAGYASKYLEQSFPKAIALCTIGCGADANPDRNQSKALALAKSQGAEIHDEIKQLISKEMQPITTTLSTAFDHADLKYDLPTEDFLKKQLKSSRPQVRQHAENMLAIKEKNGHLPTSYADPIQIWKFGDQLTMVFLGGETVVDYALRLKKEIKSENIWVTAYANDVLGYVASERIRTEGGYEVDFSMIYYNKPGRWATGTEENLIRKVHELIGKTSPK